MTMPTYYRAIVSGNLLKIEPPCCLHGHWQQRERFIPFPNLMNPSPACSGPNYRPELNPRIRYLFHVPLCYTLLHLLFVSTYVRLRSCVYRHHWQRQLFISFPNPWTHRSTVVLSNTVYRISHCRMNCYIYHLFQCTHYCFCGHYQQRQLQIHSPKPLLVHPKGPSPPGGFLQHASNCFTPRGCNCFFCGSGFVFKNEAATPV